MWQTENMRIDPAYRARLQACGLDRVEKVLARSDGRVAAWSRTTDTLFVAGEKGLPGFYVKRHFFPSWIKRLRGAFRGTFFGMHRGQAEHLALNALRKAGIPAARPVAYGARRCGHFLCACFLITEEVPDAENLTTYASAPPAGGAALSPATRRRIVQSLAQCVANMHAAGVSHDNLFWRNILIRSRPDGGPEFFLLDPQPVRAWERLGAGGNLWLRELAQLAVSSRPFCTRSEQLRFLRGYLGGQRLTPELKAQVRQMARLAEPWHAHEQRRIRMNTLFELWHRRLEREAESRESTECTLAAAEPGP